MSNNHLGTTSVSEHVASGNTKTSGNGYHSDIVTNSGPNTTTQTITCNLSPCFSAFDVAVVGTVGAADIMDCIQWHNLLPHSSYTICSIVMEQPRPSDKIFVYNSDVTTDEQTAIPQPQSIVKEKINPRSHSDKNPVCVKMVTDCEKSKSDDTSIPHYLPSGTVRQDTKLREQKPPPLIPISFTSDVTKVDNSMRQGGSEEAITASYAERQSKWEHKGCEKTFAYQAHLGFHVQNAHHVGGYYPYICGFKGCGRCFYSEHHLILHLQAHTGAATVTQTGTLTGTQTGIKSHVCPYDSCKKAFTTTGNLRNHIRTHTGEKPYKCSYKGCSRGFAEQSSLKKHELTHTGEKPYPCRICGRCFSQAGSRNTHERHRHKDKCTL